MKKLKAQLSNLKSTEARWVAAPLLFAFLIRWIPALFPHFWFDEIITVVTVRQSPAQILKNFMEHFSHPPLYYFWGQDFRRGGGAGWAGRSPRCPGCAWPRSCRAC